MPSKPTPKEMKGSSVDILNAIRNDAGSAYADNIPEAISPGAKAADGHTYSNEEALARLRAIGSALDTFEVHRNQFLNQLVNRIARVIISSRLYRNPWSPFKKGYLEMGETVEEIFVQMAKVEQYDPTLDGAGVFKRRIPDVRARFHSMNYQKKYVVTVSRTQLKTAFLSWDGVTDLLSKIIESIYSGANLDEFIMMKYLCASAILNNRTATKTVLPATLQNSDELMSVMRELALDVQTVSSEYNEAGVDTYTDPQYLYVIMTNQFSSKVDVGSLARAFNLEYVNFIGHTVGIKSFAFNGTEERRAIDLLYPPEMGSQPDHLFTDEQVKLLKSVSALAVDINWFMILDNFEDMLSIQDPDALSWNYFYHVWKTFSISPYANAIALTTEEPNITGVTVTPSTVAVGTIPTTGGSVQLKAKVNGTGIFKGAVVWSVNDNTYAAVNDTGLVSVKNHTNAATGTTVTVTATSVADPSKSGTCTITLKAST